MKKVQLRESQSTQDTKYINDFNFLNGKTGLRYTGTPKLRFSESRFSEILGFSEQKPAPLIVFIPYTVSV